MAETTYDAFISYSHKDLKWGRWVQERMERYRLPKELRKENGEPGQRMKIFRDQTDLAGVELQSSLQHELENSRHLIVICSPNSAASPWVNEEIRYFKSLGRADSIIPFVVDGEPESGKPETECFPEELRNEAGHHYIGANIREIGREKALLKVISVCLGVRFDRLADREQKRRRRTFLIAGTSVFLVTALFVGMLWRNMVTAQEKARIAEENAKLVYDNYVAAMMPFVMGDNVTAEDVARIEASANAGNMDAVFMMGYMASQGMLGGGPDEKLAFKWYKIGAEAGDPACMEHLGDFYLQGKGTEANPELGFQWCLRAAEAGNPVAMFTVGSCLYSGTGTQINAAEAAKWFLKSAEVGHTDTQLYLNLISCYALGIGVPEDHEEAFRWCKKMAENGDPVGMMLLGTFYRTGEAGEENPREAYLWYRRSAEAGNAEGMYMTAWCLENHFGVSSEAEEWYARAAEAGVEEAKEALERLRKPDETPAPETARTEPVS